MKRYDLFHQKIYLNSVLIAIKPIIVAVNFVEAIIEKK